MGNASDVSLGALRLQSRFRSDMQNNNAISDAEFNSYISNSRKELFDLLVSAYGNNYYWATFYQFTLTSEQYYPFPDGSADFLNVDGSIAEKYYKLLGIDLQYSGSPSGWISLQRIELIERNKYAYPNTATNFSGYTNLKYTPMKDGIWVTPLPMAGQLMRVWYVPTPPALQYMLSSSITLESSTITLSDVTGLTVGMNVYGTGITLGTTISAVNTTTNQITISTTAQATNPTATLSYWSDATTVDGIAGWEEYVIIDAAIKAKIKQEEDFQGLLLQKNDMKTRIESMAEGRDVGQASHTSDALSVNAYGTGMGYGGWDGGGFY